MRHINVFRKWIHDQAILPEEATYNDIMAYIEYRRSCGDSNALINRRVLSVRKYYSFFEREKRADAEPGRRYLFAGTVKLDGKRGFVL